MESRQTTNQGDKMSNELRKSIDKFDGYRFAIKLSMRVGDYIVCPSNGMREQITDITDYHVCTATERCDFENMLDFLWKGVFKIELA